MKQLPTQSVAIVVPCFNEQDGLPMLADRIDCLTERFGSDYDFSFVFVDDGSTDDTWTVLQSLFGAKQHCYLVRHDKNSGINAAISSGAARLDVDIICTMDSDCSYDPMMFGEMIPLLSDGVSVVTASPYHRDGRTEDVSAFRLLLSRGASILYRFVFHQKLATYTSCFRVYRRSALTAVHTEHRGFIGIAEVLARLDHAGYRIIEYPAVLRSRRHGASKLRLPRTIAGHLGLMTTLAFAKYFGRVQPRLVSGDGVHPNAD